MPIFQRKRARKAKAAMTRAAGSRVLMPVRAVLRERLPRRSSM
jgi:hypothetical protein